MRPVSLDATIQLPVKNVASILQRTFLGEKHFLESNERKVTTFTIVVTPFVVFMTESHEMNF